MQSQKQKNIQMIIVFINVTLYAISFQMINPVLIEIVNKLTEGSQHYGYIQSFFSLIQTIGGLIMGPLTDKYGSKIAMLLSVGGSTLYYFSLLNAQSLFMLYICNIPTFFQHMFLASQKFMVDRVDQEQRAKFNGFLGLSYGIGVLVGPKLGGMLALYSLDLTPIVATSLSFISFIMIWFAIQSKSQIIVQNQENNKENNQKKLQEKQANFVQKFGIMLKNSKVRNIFILKAFFSIGSGAFYSMLNVFLKEENNLDSSERGSVLSLFGLVATLTQAFFTPFLVNKKVNPQKALSSALLLMILGYSILYQAHEYYLILLGIVPVTIGGTILQNFQSAELTNSVNQTDTGSVLSLDMAFGSCYRIFTPTIGGYIFQNYGYQYLTLFSICSLSISTLVSFQIKPSKQEEINKAK